MTATKLKVKKGDKVIVITGRDKGKTGEIVKVMPTEQRVVVAGVNQVKKHRKPSQMNAGGIDTIDLPIHVSNVAFFRCEDQQAKPDRLQDAERRDQGPCRQALGRSTG